MLEWEQWVCAFVRSYRGEVGQLSEKEKLFLGTYISEQCLAPPTQVEVLEFDSPYRLILLFILDSRPDLEIYFHKANWKNLGTVAEQLASKHELSLDDLLRMLKAFRDLKAERLNFAVDAFDHMLGLCFPNDVRVWTPPLLKELRYPSAKDIAELVFNLNYCQAADRY